MPVKLEFSPPYLATITTLATSIIVTKFPKVPRKKWSSFSFLLLLTVNMTQEKSKAGFIPPHGGYNNLLSYQKSEIIYDGTVYFCKRFFEKYDRTIDQMVQAARSGKQNIAEASVASGTSKETEIKLTNVARASLEELLLDYKDFLRTKKLKLWEKDHRFVSR